MAQNDSSRVALAALSLSYTVSNLKTAAPIPKRMEASLHFVFFYCLINPGGKMIPERKRSQAKLGPAGRAM